MHFKCLLLVMLCILYKISSAQLPTMKQYNYLNERELYLKDNNVHTASKPIIYLDENDTTTIKEKGRSWAYRKLFNEHLVMYRNKDYNAFLDFLPDGQLGYENSKNITWLNTRGFQFEANVAKHFYLYTAVYENQGRFPTYLSTFTNSNAIIPGQGKVTALSTRTFDYSSSTAILHYVPNKYVNTSIGYGKNFIGDGYRSIILSDVAFNYPYFKITGTLGKVQYTSIWSQFIDLKSSSLSYDNVYKKKWGVFHYLDWNVNKKLSIGLFESIIWQDADSTNKRGFDWSYLNPILLLRPVEFANGSPDNALLGFNLKYKLFPKFTTYGQLLLDEFKAKEMLSNKKWWANKYAIQLGIRTFDIFSIPKLDIQAEFNTARPYTYSSRTSLLNYGHYNEPLAHPLGANFREFLIIPTYQYKRWYIRGEIMFAQYGLDPTKMNYGKDIFLSYYTHVKEYGNKIGQGIKTNLYMGDIKLSYILNPLYNLRLEAGITYRKESNEIQKSNLIWFTFGLRSSFRNIYYDL